MKKILTNVFIYNKTHILLGLKQRGFGVGKWNGFGGKIDAGETITQAAIRECQEEARITPTDLSLAGIITFHFKGQQLEVHYFRAHSFKGTPANSEEMHPKWFEHQDIPYKCMWQDDPYWMPLMLAGKYFKGTFEYNSDDSIKNHTIHSYTQPIIQHS